MKTERVIKLTRELVRTMLYECETDEEGKVDPWELIMGCAIAVDYLIQSAGAIHREFVIDSPKEKGEDHD